MHPGHEQVIDATRIVRMTAAGLEYKDQSGQLQFVDFATCARNFAWYVKNSGDFPDWHLLTADDIPKLRCVGWRDITGKPPFIELFSQPRTRIEFRRSWRCLSPESKFSEVRKRLVELGWRTFDLS